MEQLKTNQHAIGKIYFVVALILLFWGLLFGLTGALKYIFPTFLKEYLSFEKIRPLHVSSVVFWILVASMGAVIQYIQEYTAKKLYSLLLAKIQLSLFLFSIVLILASYFLGVFGGREYWEFHPVLSIPIVLGWLLFIYNFIRTLGSFKNQPVYVWMWLTGCVFFLFTFLESYLWIIPYFGGHPVVDMTMQWKSYGSMVGAWNMLMYGCSIFLMEKISDTKSYGHSRIAFLLYFTGLFNLMFNWGHHIYTLPTQQYIKHISYIVSMTELAIIGRIIYKWKDSLREAQKHKHIVAYWFLIAADVWVFLTLVLATAMSVPAINIYTHGTHVTVAHTMGATIGINTFILFAFAFDILCLEVVRNKIFTRTIKYALFVSNFALFFFWTCLIMAGAIKSQWQLSSNQLPFNQMMQALRPYFMSFFFSGCFLFIGLSAIIFALLKQARTSFSKGPTQ